jgi:gas vesicle protein
MRRFSSFVVGCICGALVGSVAALLLAPSSGDELRGQAEERIRSFSDEVRKAYEDRVAQLEEELEALRGRIRKIEA